MDTQFLTQVAMFSGLDQVALQDLCRCLTPHQACSPLSRARQPWWRACRPRYSSSSGRIS